jgi:chromosome segregation ATPase
MKLRQRIGRWLSGDTKTINALESNVRLLKEQLDTAKNEAKEYAKRNESHLSDMAKQITDLCDKRDKLTSENKTLTESLATVKEQLEKSLTSEKKQQETISNLKAELKDVKQKYTALTKKNRQNKESK